MKLCPHCRAEQPDLGDAYCSNCRQELPATATTKPETGAKRTVTLNDAGWLLVATLQGLMNLTFLVAVLVWLVLSVVGAVQSE